MAIRGSSDDYTGSNSMYDYPTSSSRLLPDKEVQPAIPEIEPDEENTKKLFKSHSAREDRNKWTMTRKHSISTMEPKYHSDDDPNKTSVKRTFSLKKLGTVIFGKKASNEDPIEGANKVQTPRSPKDSPPMPKLPNEDEKDSSSDTSKTPSSSGSPQETPPDSREISPSSLKKKKWYHLRRDKSPVKSRNNNNNNNDQARATSPGRRRNPQYVKDNLMHLSKKDGKHKINDVYHNDVYHRDSMVIKKLVKSESYETLERVIVSHGYDQQNIRRLLAPAIEKNFEPEFSQKMITFIEIIINKIPLTKEEKKRGEAALLEKKGELFSFCFNYLNQNVSLQQSEQIDNYMAFLEQFISKFGSEGILLKALAKSFKENYFEGFLLKSLVDIGLNSLATKIPKEKVPLFRVCSKTLPHFSNAMQAIQSLFQNDKIKINDPEELKKYACFLITLAEEMSLEHRKILASAILAYYTPTDLFRLIEAMVDLELGRRPQAALRQSVELPVILMKAYVDNTNPNFVAELVKWIIQKARDRDPSHLILENVDVNVGEKLQGAHKDYAKLNGAQLEIRLAENSKKLQALFKEIIIKLHEAKIPDPLVELMKMIKRKVTMHNPKEEPYAFAFQFFYLYLINPGLISKEIRQEDKLLQKTLEHISKTLQKLLQENLDGFGDVTSFKNKIMAQMFNEHRPAHFEYMKKVLDE